MAEVITAGHHSISIIRGHASGLLLDNLGPTSWRRVGVSVAPGRAPAPSESESECGRQIWVSEEATQARRPEGEVEPGMKLGIHK